MTMTLPMVLIVVTGVFLAAFMDAIAGGGGIVSLPTYLLAGLPMHMALGTNKISATLGGGAALTRFVKNGYVTWRLALPAAALALVGSACGTRLQLLIDEMYLQVLLLVVLPVVAVVVLRQRAFPEEPGNIAPRRQLAVVCLAALAVGAYDGFYGPGTGTFLLLIFTRWGKMDVRTASGNVKVVNTASGIGSMVTAMLHGQVFWQLGLLATAASLTGSFLGAGLAIKNGSKIVRPVVLVVLALLAVKVISGLL